MTPDLNTQQPLTLMQGPQPVLINLPPLHHPMSHRPSSIVPRWKPRLPSVQAISAVNRPEAATDRSTVDAGDKGRVALMPACNGRRSHPNPQINERTPIQWRLECAI